MQMTNFNRRKSTGQAMSEFSTSLIVLISFVFLPLINLGIIPVRYLIAQGVLTEMTHRLALCEKRSQAHSLLDSDPWFRSVLSKCGVTISNTKLTMSAYSKDAESMLSVTSGQAIPDTWLPNGEKEPTLYTLGLACECSISPLFSGCDGLPGITSPVAISIKSASPWENISRDPETSNYYLNE
jgi:hypothetical protein